MEHGVWPAWEKPGEELAFLVRREGGEEARPVAQPLSRCGFTEEEWRGLAEAPLRAFLWVATADGPVCPRERAACRRVLEAGLYARSPLVGRICGESLRQLDAPGRPRERPGLEPLGALGARVEERRGLGEAARWRGCLLEVGWRVARASSGLPGLVGWVRGVERRALESLAQALGRPGG